MLNELKEFYILNRASLFRNYYRYSEFVDSLYDLTKSNECNQDKIKELYEEYIKIKEIIE